MPDSSARIRPLRRSHGRALHWALSHGFRVVRSGGIRTATCRSNMNGTIVALMTFAEILSLVQTLPDIAYKLMQMLMQALLCRAYPSQALRRYLRFRMRATSRNPSTPRATQLQCRHPSLPRALYSLRGARARRLGAFLSQTSLTKLAWEMEACEPRLADCPLCSCPARTHGTAAYTPCARAGCHAAARARYAAAAQMTNDEDAAHGRQVREGRAPRGRCGLGGRCAADAAWGGAHAYFQGARAVRA